MMNRYFVSNSYAILCDILRKLAPDEEILKEIRQRTRLLDNDGEEYGATDYENLEFDFKKNYMKNNYVMMFII